MQVRELKIENVPIDALKPALYNPRSWSQVAIRDLTESIKRFGLVDPIIVNCSPERENIVIGGHFRLQVAKDLGFQNVPVVFVNLPNIEKEKELNLRLNKNQGEWDLHLLQELDLEMLLDVGFSDSELSSIWDESLSVDNDNFDLEKEIAQIEETTCKTGDLYQLGNHRLICGDATKTEIIKNLIQDNKVDMLNLDSPYNIGLNYSKGIGQKQSYGGKKTNDNKNPAEFRQFLTTILQNCLEHTKENSHVFHWCDPNSIGLIQSLFTQLSIEPKRVCMWIKNNCNATPQIAFNRIYEPCVYGIKGKPYLNKSFTNFSEISNKEINSGNRCFDDIADLLDIWLCKREATGSYNHPTQKPPELYEKSLKRCSKPNDVILEAYGGSGSLLIACEQLKRRCFLSEIEPIFCDLIIKRWEKLTGEKAKLIRNIYQESEVKNVS